MVDSWSISQLKGRRGGCDGYRALVEEMLRDWTLQALTDHGADGMAAALARQGDRRNARFGYVWRFGRDGKSCTGQ